MTARRCDVLNQAPRSLWPGREQPVKRFRPRFGEVPLTDGLRWRPSADWRFEEKLDGRWHEKRIGQSVIVGELMPSGDFFAFDIVIHIGVDVRPLALCERLTILNTFNLARPATGCGGEFLEAVLSRGGEGVVAKRLDAPFGVDWWRCKRIASFDCVVTERDCARGSIRLSLDGQDVGWCPARQAFDSIGCGDVVEVAAFGRHGSGKLREARFIRLRPDKPRFGLAGNQSAI